MNSSAAAAADTDADIDLGRSPQGSGDPVAREPVSGQHLDAEAETDKSTGNPHFRTLAAALVAAVIVSRVGDQLSRVVLAWGTSENFGGPAAAAWMGFALSVPLVVFAIFGGILVDRTDHFKAMIWSNAGAAVVVAAMAVLWFGGDTSLIQLLVGAGLLSAVTAVFVPAMHASLPAIVGNDKTLLVNTDAWILGSITAAGLVGPIIGGALLTWLEPGWILGMDAASFVISAALLVWIARGVQREGPRDRRGRRSPFADLLVGWRYIFSHPALRTQFAVFPVTDAALAALVFVLPSFILQELGGSSRSFGLLLAALAAGRIIGNFSVARTKLRTVRGRVLQVNLFVQGVGLTALAVSGSILPAMAALFIAGLPSGAAQVSLSSYLQMETPPEIRGKIFGSLISLVSSLMPLGPLVFGAIAAVDPRAAVMAIGITLLVGGLPVLANRSLGAIR